MRISTLRLLAASLLATAMLASIAPCTAHAQTAASGDTGRAQIAQTVFGLGGNFSPMTGIGLSLRMHFPMHASAMLTAYGFKTSDEVMFDYGLELQYDLIVKERLRFYAMGGASHFYDENRTDFQPHNTFGDPDRLGAGFGIEMNFIGDDLCVAVALALTSFQPSGDLIPYPSANLHYYFR